MQEILPLLLQTDHFLFIFPYVTKLIKRTAEIALEFGVLIGMEELSTCLDVQGERKGTAALLWALLKLLSQIKCINNARLEQMSFSFYPGVCWESRHITESKLII